MAKWIRPNGKTEDIDAPVALDRFQTLCGGFIRFISIARGGTIVVNEASPGYADLNEYASKLAGQAIYGDAVHCEPGDIA